MLHKRTEKIEQEKLMALYYFQSVLDEVNDEELREMISWFIGYLDSNISEYRKIRYGLSYEDIQESKLIKNALFVSEFIKVYYGFYEFEKLNNWLKRRYMICQGEEMMKNEEHKRR